MSHFSHGSTACYSCHVYCIFVLITPTYLIKFQGLANEDNFAKDRLKQEALKQKECLGELLLRSNNETSKLNLSLDTSRVYLISSDFISDWRKFIR